MKTNKTISILDAFLTQDLLDDDSMSVIVGGNNMDFEEVSSLFLDNCSCHFHERD